MVVAVVSLLAVAVVPAVRSTLDGLQIAGAANFTEAELLLARQTAITRNLPVEVRLYKSDDGSGDAWCMVALVIPSLVSGQDTDEWITRGKMLPGSVVFDESSDYSTLVSKATPATSERIAPWLAIESSSAPKALQGKDYVGFLFNADGSINLPKGQPWCVTLKNAKSKPVDAGPAANFVSIVLDSNTGRALAYQP